MHITLPHSPAVPATGTLTGATPEERSQSQLLMSLISGEPLRVAARRAALRRDAAKQLIERESMRVARAHAMTLPGLRVPELVCCSARAFVSKERTGHPARARHDDSSGIWTHGWLDPGSELVAVWLLGPKWLPQVAERHGFVVVWQIFEAMSRARALLDILSASRALAPTHLTSWLAALGPGLWKKTREHWLATGLFAAAHNFLTQDGQGQTPAMRAGWATSTWHPGDLIPQDGTDLRVHCGKPKDDGPWPRAVL
jgi:hypothetical protein